ncbi:uncharacterized protein LOC106175190 isoform X2 [Lingula anatina]|uniref:Uncharacterized protein LOC106175190 isoform X2 n=1 Tax=Lingula anatina TaxID=7574 RepID=A0A1S3JRA9_LINAN|nr:uncharacterized protein LOC106175190 isoform X2 [Lingula anatina]|eukprot:XP_013412519.1 uncharacterized protein LOC106175190 isoform X2 [Lingula anatina]
MHTIFYKSVLRGTSVTDRAGQLSPRESKVCECVQDSFMATTFGGLFTMSEPQSNKKLSVCGFCKRGVEVSAVCGELCTSNVCSAHKKCMQYSANLSQYKEEFAFGGFNIDEVLTEIRRGRSLKCRICLKTKGLKKKKKPELNGATAGCAINSCKMTYHFYCAAQDPIVITRRFVEKNSSGKEIVKYRVFCNQAHLDSYNNNKGQNSCSDIEDGDSEDIEDGDYKDFICKNHKNINEEKEDEKQQSVMFGDLSSNSSSFDEDEVSANNIQSQGSSARKLVIPVTRVKLENVLSEAKESFCQSFQQTEMYIDRKEMPISSQWENKNTVVQENPSLSSQAVEIPDATLYIVECDITSPEARRIIKSLELYNTAEAPSIVWNSSFGHHAFKAKEVLHYLLEVSSVLKNMFEASTEEKLLFHEDLESLLLHLKNEKVHFFRKLVQHNSSLPEATQQRVTEGYRGAVRDNVRATQRNLGYEDMAKYVIMRPKRKSSGHTDFRVHVLQLKLNDFTDPDRVIRLGLTEHVQPHMHVMADLQSLFRSRQENISEERQQIYDLSECSCIKQWLLAETDSKFQVICYPQEVVLQDGEKVCVISMLKSKLRALSNVNSFQNILFLLGPVDKEVINYAVYCRKVLRMVLQKCTPSTTTSNTTPATTSIYCVIDISGPGCHHLRDEILPVLREDARQFSFLTWSNPEQAPVSCLIVKVVRKTEAIDSHVLNTDKPEQTARKRLHLGGSSEKPTKKKHKM